MNNYLTLSLMSLAAVAGTARGMDDLAPKLQLIVANQETATFKVEAQGNEGAITIDGDKAKEYFGGLLNSLASVQQSEDDNSITMQDHILHLFAQEATQPTLGTSPEKKKPGTRREQALAYGKSYGVPALKYGAAITAGILLHKLLGSNGSGE